MKITKKIRACGEICSEPAVAAVAEVSAPAVAECKYQSAIDLVSAAIEALAGIAKDDEIAKDSIANLGVVLFDLKGEC